jgi:N-acylneuraminate cytidylyltransferase/CMP-N,N'-diacetyllegionaminic acid synthase
MKLSSGMICVNEEFMLAIIPARGGSKGVPKKNIRLLGGKPLIQWTIEAAMHATNLDRVILSTDDEEIAEVCKPLGVEIPFMRPKELARDDSRGIDTYIYTIDRLNEKLDYGYKEFVVLQPTSPLRLPEDIDNSIDLYLRKKADSVISCVEMSHPPLWTLKMDNKGIISNYFDFDDSGLNRQDLNPAYFPNGAVHVLKYSLVKEKHTYYSNNTFAYVMPQERSVDIDCEIDFKFAEFLMMNNDIYSRMGYPTGN